VQAVQVSRVCSVCESTKPVSGVWYLLPPRGRDAPFVCESCFKPLAAEPA
jgi:hypothetical protein